ncbi:zinc finger protein 622 [Actinidia rufa]|uniref:Zinc finger protein 622 n=1 Tax=Actinidia rufa TaxID=165716 RepID=A0A7J0FDB3_9ERIC|nr:zinc finger protein 622 [Actinidia rufa]
MPGLSCNACNKGFEDESEQKVHYKSEWHRYNLKRKVAGVPGVTETLFLARQSALAEEKNKSIETPMLYSCGLCGKGYRSSKAHAQHLKSRSHAMRAAQGSSHLDGESAIIKPLLPRAETKLSQQREQDEDSEETDEWEEVDPEEDLLGEAIDSVSHLSVNEHAINAHMVDDDDECALDPTCCFMCDLEHNTIDSCMVHMHKQHGFFIPDVEYLKDPKGLLTYLGLKKTICILHLCCHPFCRFKGISCACTAMRDVILSTAWKHYVDTDGKQLVAYNDMSNTVELGSGGSELIITRRTDDRTSTKMLGSREYLRYYRQKPRPSPTNDFGITAALASRYRSMGLATVQSKDQMVRMKVMKEMNRSGVEAMRSKIGMKSNVIRNLPNNVYVLVLQCRHDGI